MSKNPIEISDNLMAKLETIAQQIRDCLIDADKICLITHTDCDGVSSSFIWYEIFEYLDKPYLIINVEYLNSLNIKNISRKSKKYDTLIFSDIGSGQIDLILKNFEKNKTIIIVDHHPVIVRKKDNVDKLIHLNPHLIGLDGSVVASGATMSYLVAKEFFLYNLSKIAIIGALGDFQDRPYTKLIGINEIIVENALTKGFVEKRIGLSFFGRETKPLRDMLATATSPYLPEITGNKENARAFLRKIDIKEKDNNRYRCYHDLSDKEKDRLISAIKEHCEKNGVPPDEIKKLISEYYMFPDEKDKTEMKDASEFSMLLNSCGRARMYKIALKLCKGEISSYYKARYLLKKHRLKIKNGVKEIIHKGFRTLGSHVKYFYSANIDSSIIGTIIGIALRSNYVSSDSVVIGAADQDYFHYKISVRATEHMIRKGINLSVALENTSKQIKCEAGGHRGAGGGIIIKYQIDDFLSIFTKEIETQLIE